jgi:DNA-binding MarR family transcriptional regulator
MRLLFDTYPGDDADIGAFDLITATRRFTRHIQTKLNHELEGLGVSYAQYELLEMLARRPRVHGAELARRLRVTPQNVVGLQRQLLRAGLIELTAPDWSRGASLTEAGLTRLRLCRRALTRLLARIDLVEPRLRRTLFDTMEEIDWALRRPEPPPWERPGYPPLTGGRIATSSPSAIAVDRAARS